jgi:predicted DNA-binding transcriptional regulator AlpA
MPPADPAVGLFGADLPALAEAIAERLAEKVIVPQTLDGRGAARYLGLSRSGFARARAAGALPRPVLIEGSGMRYRKRDLDEWLARRKPGRK